jgi:hypothetical protein
MKGIEERWPEDVAELPKYGLSLESYYKPQAVKVAPGVQGSTNARKTTRPTRKGRSPEKTTKNAQSGVYAE